MTKTIKNIPFSELHDLVKKICGKGVGKCIDLTPAPIPVLRKVSVISHRLKTTLNARHFSCFHDLFVLKIHLSGISRGYVENNVYDFQPGEGFLIFPFQMHKIISTNPEGQLRLVINFSMSQSDQPAFEPLRNKIFKVTAKDCKLLKQIMELSAMHSESKQREAINNLTEFLMSLLERCRDLPASRSTATESARTVFDYLYKHYREGLSVKEIADRLGYSEAGVRIIFRRETGRTPGAFMQELILHDAAEQLLYTDKSIQTISKECGFTNSFIFSRAFKNKIGKSPKAFREDVKNY